MTPAARAVVEAVHAGATLAMHYRPKDGGENERCFVLEPRGRRVFAPTAILAVRSEHLKAADDGLPGLAVTQTWTAGAALPPLVAPPPFIEGSNVRDTAIAGLRVRFFKSGSGWHAAVLHRASGKVVLGDLGRLRVGKREFVRRVDESRLNEVDWAAIDPATATPGEHARLGREAREQILGAAPGPAAHATWEHRP